MKGYIKLYRQTLEWEWYKDIPTKVTFIHLLLIANHDEKKWRGQVIKAGQLITSYNRLAQETNLTVRQVRTSIERLSASGEIEIKTNNQFTLITILNWSKWQENGKSETNENRKSATNGNTNSDSNRTEVATNERHANDTQNGTQTTSENASSNSDTTEVATCKRHATCHENDNKQEVKKEREINLSLYNVRTHVNPNEPVVRIGKREREIFKSFCKRNNVRNFNAYMRTIINSGDYQTILDEEKERTERLKAKQNTEIKQIETIENEVKLPPDFFQKVREQARKGEYAK